MSTVTEKHILVDYAYDWCKACGRSFREADLHICSCGTATCLGCYDFSGKRCSGDQCDRNADREER